eukprot:4543729-Lingulodinium_polyedra.AAC.1
MVSLTARDKIAVVLLEGASWNLSKLWPWRRPCRPGPPLKLGYSPLDRAPSVDPGCGGDQRAGTIGNGR